MTPLFSVPPAPHSRFSRVAGDNEKLLADSIVECGVALGESQNQIELTLLNESGDRFERRNLAPGLPADDCLAGSSAAFGKLLLGEACPIAGDTDYISGLHGCVMQASPL